MITLTDLQQAKDDVQHLGYFAFEDIRSLGSGEVTGALDEHCDSIDLAECAKMCCRTCLLKKLDAMIEEETAKEGEMSDLVEVCNVCPCNADCENRGKGIDGVIDVERPIVMFLGRPATGADPYYHCYDGPREQMNPFGIKLKFRDLDGEREILEGGK